ncbi:uncharacterized protein PHALS_03934 [Plasmopara halstedii]|uniref:Uncharacterized protein n=1 Tax=Plasmopara halstedii TaxID=4781 RepID=A0A0P1A936_PLAHL|nr:uncharacterized protein PHALS_03934 [Plasmopara halstedii]CEG36726.1 hypothetical protein PHALS_03934 [Plasmopara halstedii]|eukprot:XP_024573095.1 hypothetical protein PHALS_03934 [Plasmopara halstedii]
MNESVQDAATGAPLAAHFATKRRLMATVKQMEERGEKIEEATPEEVLEAVSKAAETVFKFDFTIEDGTTSVSKRNRKRSMKRRGKKKKNGAEDGDSMATLTKSPPRSGSTKQCSQQAPKQSSIDEPNSKIRQSSSIVRLRKATSTDSEMTKMHLRYGQGRRNLAAIKQREQRKKAAIENHSFKETVSSTFKFNFVATS